jgi:hypothetical protein
VGTKAALFCSPLNYKKGAHCAPMLFNFHLVGEILSTSLLTKGMHKAAMACPPFYYQQVGTNAA